MDLETLRKQRDKHITSFFWLGLKIAAIFAVPAVAAAMLGKKVDLARGGEEKTFTILFLVIAFFISWVVVAIQFKKINKKMSLIESQIKDLKSKELENPSTGSGQAPSTPSTDSASSLQASSGQEKKDDGLNNEIK